MGHVCKLSVGHVVAASISSNITFAACLDHLCIGASQVKSLLFQHGKSAIIPDCCHRCSDAWGTSASTPFVRTLPLRSAATSLLRRVLIIGASQVKSLPFQHRKSHFILDCCHRCSDSRGTSESSPFVRTFPLRSAATSLLRRVLIIGASVRPKSSRSRFNTASQSSFWIAATVLWMLGARLQARRSFGRCRFDLLLFDILVGFLAFRDFCQHRLDLLHLQSASFRSAIHS